MDDVDLSSGMLRKTRATDEVEQLSASNRSSIKRKALLAVAFAGAMLNSQVPVVAHHESQQSDSLIQKIANNGEIDPADRAFYLLRLGSCYLSGDQKANVEAQFQPVASAPNSRYLIGTKSRGWDDLLTSWAEQLAPKSSTVLLPQELKQQKPVSEPVSPQDIALAESAIHEAVIQLDKVSDPFARLNLYFIASQLLEKSGAPDGIQLKCKNILEQSFRSAETSALITEQQAKAAASVLNSIAYGLIPVHIQDAVYNPQEPINQVKSFSESDFEKSEKLKRRAIEIVDRLPATSHVRRKGHRDFALWYMALGKNKQADSEKQILFRLVGRSDDRLLYPQAAGCGHVVWWQPDKGVGIGIGCGMG